MGFVSRETKRIPIIFSRASPKKPDTSGSPVAPSLGLCPLAPDAVGLELRDRKPRGHVLRNMKPQPKARYNVYIWE